MGLRAATFRKEPSEKAFMRMVVDYARLRGWMVYHTFDSRRSEPGYPDLHLVRGSESVFCELKSGRGVLSPSQSKWLDALRGAGCRVKVWWPEMWSEVEEVLI